MEGLGFLLLALLLTTLAAAVLSGYLARGDERKWIRLLLFLFLWFMFGIVVFAGLMSVFSIAYKTAT